MLIRIQLTNLHQIFCELVINTKAIYIGIIGPVGNVEEDLQA